MSAVLLASASALPPVMAQDALWRDFFAAHYRGSRLAEEVWRRSGIRNRHGVVDPREEDLRSWSTAERMRRFVTEALPLGKEAVAASLALAGCRPADVGHLTVASCTGYATPGLDILLARDLGLPADVQRLHVGHMGCYAAIPALASLSDTVTARGKVGVLLCLELTSLHIQPPSSDREQMVAHALFSDAAAAVTVAPEDFMPDRPGHGASVPGGSVPGGPVPLTRVQTAGDTPLWGLQVVDVVARTDVASAGLMSWDVTDFGFRMGLSPRVPRVLRRHVGEVVAQLLERHGLRTADVAGWAVHPGGPSIVDVVADEVGLDPRAVADSKAVLRDHGNASSPTVLLVLQRIMRRGLVPGDHVVAMAFGPGLTLYAMLLRRQWGPPGG